MPERGISFHQHWIYRFPLEKASEISARTILKFLEAHPDMEVRMVCFDGETLGIMSVL